MGLFDRDGAGISGWEEPPERMAEREQVLASVPQILDGPEMAPPRARPTGRPEPKGQRLVHEIYRWTGGPTDAFKTDVRYVSAGVRNASGVVQVDHEHVWQVHKLRDRLLAGEDPRGVLSDACACLVTPDEHKVLNRQRCYTGWERYAQADIAVWDRAEGRWVDLSGTPETPGIKMPTQAKSEET